MWDDESALRMIDKAIDSTPGGVENYPQSFRDFRKTILRYQDIHARRRQRASH
jgi:hypothetical protein